MAPPHLLFPQSEQEPFVVNPNNEDELGESGGSGKQIANMDAGDYGQIPWTVSATFRLSLNSRCLLYLIGTGRAC